VSHYETEREKNCKLCVSHGAPDYRDRGHTTNDGTIEDCTAPTLEAFAEQQAELAKTAWKAGAEAMRETAATLVESEQVPLQDNSNVRLQRAAAFIRTLPIPEEPK
jgi:hypothetical protein